MTREIYDRFKEICPTNKIADMTPQDIKHDCNVAFKIIGYEAVDLDGAFEKAWETSNAVMLYEFIYDVWEASQ